jgi:methionine sulfoxide reductase catalytic subunit
MVRFDAAHRAVHYPPDRRFRIWIRPSILIGIAITFFSVILASWIEVAVVGLPSVPAVPQVYPNNFARTDFQFGSVTVTSSISFSC